MGSGELQSAHDEYYFEHYAERPYRRDPHWLDFFGRVADRIDRDLRPRTVLDAGCALGFLVEKLRERGVEAMGVDASPFALSQIAPEIRPYCWLGSLVQPLSQRWDLVVCIEVLEHLTPEDGKAAVANICAATDDVLMSSTPFEYKDATHENVRPPDYWAAVFARHGFYRDVEYDASYVAPWAMRFRRVRESTDRVVAAYERRLWELERENRARRELTLEQRNQLAQGEGLQRSTAATLAESDRKVAELSSEVAERQREVALLGAQAHEQQQRIRDLRAHEREREDTLGRLREEVEILGRRVVDLEARHDEDRSLRLREVRTREEGIETLRRRLAEKDEMVRRLAEQLHVAQTTARSLDDYWGQITRSRGWALLQVGWRLRSRFRRPRRLDPEGEARAAAVAALDDRLQPEVVVRPPEERRQRAACAGRGWSERTPYRIPDGVAEIRIDGRPVLSTAQGGKVAVDEALLALWCRARDRSLEEIVAGSSEEEACVRAGLACLAEAGLLEREDFGEPESPGEACGGTLVSVVVVAFQGRDWLETCLPSLFAQTWDALEVLVVDNGSGDGTAEWMETAFPQARLVRLKRSIPLSAAINHGVARARGEHVLILNQDVFLARDAVAELMRVARTHSGCAAIQPKLRFWWAPGFLNGLGNYVDDHSWGSDNGIGQLDLGQLDDQRVLASGCFAALLVPRSAWERVGSADERFQLYYEDVEWCHRARLLGLTIQAAPRAVVYHAFGSRAPTGRSAHLDPAKLGHVVAGRLRFAAKLCPRPFLGRFLGNYAREDRRHAWAALRAGRLGTARAYARGWLRFAVRLPILLLERRSLRRRTTGLGRDLFAFEPQHQRPFVWQGLPELTWESVRDHYLQLIREGRTKPMPELEGKRRPLRLLIVSQDVVDRKLAGPGMRYLEMARALAADLDVTLAVPAETTLESPPVKIVRYFEERPGSLHLLVENSDVAIVSGYMARKFEFLERTHTRIVVDLYDPLVLENLHYHEDEPLSARERCNEEAVDVTNRLARLGDFFLCGNERQRDFWLGTLAANHRINPHTFAQDPSLDALIDVVGIGFPDRPPVPRKAILRGVHEAFPADARIVLWGGGLWDWLDPLTLVEAWPRVIAAHPEARLVFLGTRHPNPRVPIHKMAARTEEAASRIGERDRSVFFHEWLSYEDRESLLCECDVGVTLHPMHVETRYSIRTRVFDYVWARLPVVTTGGDVTSEWIREHAIGRVVPPHAPEAVAEAIVDLLSRPRDAGSPAFEQVRERFTWERVVDPLRRYCQIGGPAPDRRRGAEDVVASRAVGS